VAGIAWSWPDAVRSGLCALHAAALAAVDPSAGLAWAAGTLPVAVMGLAPTRRRRRRLIVIGVALAASVVCGSLFAQTSLTTVLGIFAVAYAAAIVASRAAAGLFALTLCLPVCAVGLSYSDLSKAVALGALFIASAVFSYVVLWAWPEFESPPPPGTQQLLPKALARRYGVLAGLAGASSALVGILVHTDHVGWAPAAGYFVMRPSAQMQRMRSAGRLISVTCGAATAVVFVRTTPSAAPLGVYAVLVLVGAGGTRASRWYVTPFFGSALVLTLLLYADPTTANEQWRFNQRVGMTAVGIGFAYFYGLFVSQLLVHRHQSHAAKAHPRRP